MSSLSPRTTFRRLMIAAGTVALLAVLSVALAGFAPAATRPHKSTKPHATSHKTRCRAAKRKGRRDVEKCKRPVHKKPKRRTTPSSSTSPSLPASPHQVKLPKEDGPHCPGISTRGCECPTRVPDERAIGSTPGETLFVVPKPSAESCGGIASVTVTNAQGEVVAQLEVPEGGPARSFSVPGEGTFTATASDTTCEKAVGHFTLPAEQSYVTLQMQPSTCG